MRRLAALFASLSLAGCVMGIPDAWEPAKNRPCDKVVVVKPDNVGVCMTEAQFRRWTCRNMPGGCI